MCCKTRISTIPSSFVKLQEVAVSDWLNDLALEELDNPRACSKSTVVFPASAQIPSDFSSRDSCWNACFFVFGFALVGFD